MYVHTVALKIEKSNSRTSIEPQYIISENNCLKVVEHSQKLNLKCEGKYSKLPKTSNKMGIFYQQ